MNKKVINVVFIAKLIAGGIISKNGNGNQPPKNNKLVNKDINIMCEYSASINKANVILEYSTLYPDTSSDSPSVKSNGALFVSAKAEIKNIIAAGNNGIINHISRWAKTRS